MRYKTAGATGDLEGVEKFLKEMGAESKAPESRLNITKSGLPSDTTVVLLEPAASPRLCDVVLAASGASLTPLSDHAARGDRRDRFHITNEQFVITRFRTCARVNAQSA